METVIFLFFLFSQLFWLLPTFSCLGEEEEEEVARTSPPPFFFLSLWLLTLFMRNDSAPDCWWKEGRKTNKFCWIDAQRKLNDFQNISTFDCRQNVIHSWLGNILILIKTSRLCVCGYVWRGLDLAKCCSSMGDALIMSWKKRLGGVLGAGVGGWTVRPWRCSQPAIPHA